MAEEKQLQNVLDPELDSLLDDALEDFSKPLPTAAVSAAALPAPATGAPAAGATTASNPLTEEMIAQATKNFEASMRKIMAQQHQVTASAAALREQASEGGGSTDDQLADVAQFDVNALTAEFSKFAETASKVAASGAPSTVAVQPQPDQQPDFQKLMADTMTQMAQNNQEYQSAPSEDELSQLLAGMGLGSGADGGAAGLFPLMQTMLENILTKDVLYPPIKEIVDKYPDWLADNRATVEPAEFDRFSRQFDAMKNVVELFESENESDSDEVKAKRFEDLLILMQKLQAEGHPPTELAGEVAGEGGLPDFASFDPSNPGAAGLPDFGAMLGNLATAPPSTATGQDAEGNPPNVGEEQCSVM